MGNILDAISPINFILGTKIHIYGYVVMVMFEIEKNIFIELHCIYPFAKFILLPQEKRQGPQFKVSFERLSTVLTVFIGRAGLQL